MLIIFTFFKFQDFEEDNSQNATFYFYLIENNLVDVDPFPREMIIDTDSHPNLESTKACSTELFQIGQVLNKPNNLENSDLSSFLFENINVLVYILIGYLLLFVSSFVFLKKVLPKYRSFKISKLFLNKLLFLDSNQLRQLSCEIALIFIFFSLFLFIVTNILSNLIKTNKVVVNTDEFIDSIEKLFTTKKSFTFQPEDLPYFNRTSKSSFLYKFYHKKIERENRFVSLDDQTKFRQFMMNNKLNSLFFFMKQSGMLIVLAFISPFTRNQFIFMGPVR